MMALEKNIKSIVHFMAFPGPRLGRSVQLGEAPKKYLIDSINFIAGTKFYNGIEITTIKDPEIRAEVAKLLKKHKFYITYSAQPVQLINEDKLIEPTDISSVDEIERENAVKRLKECLEEAYEMGCDQFAFLSGQDPGTEQGLQKRVMATGSLLVSIEELCKYSRELAKQYKREKMKMTLEIFDREHCKGFKGQLIGPHNEAKALAHNVRNDGYEEFGLLYDLSHMFLIKSGFESENVDVIKTLKPFLNWIHIGNSVTDKKSPLYGDYHVSMDHPEGAVTPHVVRDFFTALVDVGYESGIGLEVMPIPPDQLSESVVMTGIAAFKAAAEEISVNYAIGSYRFKTRKFLPERLFYRITEERIKDPDIVKKEAAKRKQRKRPYDKNIIIIAADHPARYVTRVGDDPLAMGDRQQYLGRIARTLIDPQIDGVMATPDLIDDLMILNKIFVDAGGKSFMDEKIIIGCLNRSGLAGSSHEMMDRLTAYTPKDLADLKYDGAKMMFRIDLETSQARYSQETLEQCSKWIRECNQYNIPAYLEPLPVEKTDSGYKVKMNHVDLIKTIGVATALSGSSTNIWLKVPYVDNFELVARSTSNPILLLGGESSGYPPDTMINFEKGLGAGPNIKGALVGRNLLYPGYDDPLAVSLAVGKIIHESETAEDAIKYLVSQRGKDMDYLTKVIYSPKSQNQ